TTDRPKCSGVFGSAPNRTTCSLPGRGRSTPATSTPRFACWPGLPPFEVWSSYPVRLDGEAALELPGGAAHSGYPLALAVCAVLASVRSAWRDAGALGRRGGGAN